MARTKRLRRVLLVALVVVLAGGGAVVWASSGSSSGGYRTVIAGPASVTATLDTSGTIQPVSNATLTFPVSGQVSSIPVQVGQQVTAGQTLAQLDTTSLAGQVSSAQSTLATAQARLAADQSGQSSAAASGSGGRATPALYVTAASTGGAPPDLRSQQDAVIAAQHQVDLDLTAAQAAVNKQKEACAPVTSPPPASTTTTTTTSNPPPASQDDVDACTTAIQQAQDAQRTTFTDEQKLASAEDTLSQTLANLAAASQQGTAPKGQSTTPKSQPTAPKSSSGSTKTTTISADQLAADQAAVDAANAEVAVAQQNLAAATLVSPLTGMVANIGLTVGQPAGQQHIVVIGPGANQVTTAVSDTQAGQIKPGQQATVTPDGSTTALTGQVTSIGLLASTTSSGSPSYPVTISLPSSADALFSGATASVSIITSTAGAAVTVPTSAVHLQGSFATVSVLVNGQPQPKRVALGVIGASVTEIRSGLNAGDEVVLADLSQPLPTSNTNSRGRVGGGGPQQRGTTGGGGAGAKPGS